MNYLVKPILTLISLWMAFLIAVPAPAQSLAELARQTRAKKQQSPNTEKTFTNDTIPVATISSAPSNTAAASETAPAPAEGEAATADATAESGEPTLAELEEEYRAKYAELKQKLDTEERRLDVLQRELNLSQQQFYSDPNVAMQEQYSRNEINERTAELEAQRVTVEQARQAITDLETELRQKSLPPGWAR